MATTKSLRLEHEGKERYLYRIYQRAVMGFDTYSDAVVCASSESAAKDIHPSGSWEPDYAKYLYPEYADDPENAVRYDWVQRHQTDLIQVEYLGIADSSIAPGRVICTDFHGG